MAALGASRKLKAMQQGRGDVGLALTFARFSINTLLGSDTLLDLLH